MYLKNYENNNKKNYLPKSTTKIRNVYLTLLIKKIKIININKINTK